MSGKKDHSIIELLNDGGSFPPLMAKDGLRAAAISYSPNAKRLREGRTGDMGHPPS